MKCQIVDCHKQAIFTFNFTTNRQLHSPLIGVKLKICLCEDHYPEAWLDSLQSSRILPPEPEETEDLDEAEFRICVEAICQLGETKTPSISNLPLGKEREIILHDEGIIMIEDSSLRACIDSEVRLARLAKGTEREVISCFGRWDGLKNKLSGCICFTCGFQKLCCEEKINRLFGQKVKAWKK